MAVEAEEAKTMAVAVEDTNQTITTLPAVDQNILATTAVAINHPMHDLIVSFPNQSL